MSRFTSNTINLFVAFLMAVFIALPGFIMGLSLLMVLLYAVFCHLQIAVGLLHPPDDKMQKMSKLNGNHMVHSGTIRAIKSIASPRKGYCYSIIQILVQTEGGYRILIVRYHTYGNSSLKHLQRGDSVEFLYCENKPDSIVIVKKYV